MKTTRHTYRDAEIHVTCPDDYQPGQRTSFDCIVYPIAHPELRPGRYTIEGKYRFVAAARARRKYYNIPE